MRQLIHKFIAFTLAETLIVMGIIGVVAALTIPNLNSSTADKEKVAKVKKVYSNLNDALGRAEAVYGPVSEWTKDDANVTAQTTRIGERLTEFMKLSKNCGAKGAAGATDYCFSAGALYTMNGTKSSIWPDTNTEFYTATLADGTGLVISTRNLTNNRLFWATINIDGKTKRSTYGKNTFEFYALEDQGIVTYSPEACLASLTSGSSCAGWIIQNDNMDYLKVGTTDKKCPNGKTVLDGTTNISCK